MRKKKTFADHWHELRYHMVAGLFWYLVSLISWSGVGESFHYLREHIGLASTILVDFTCVLVLFLITAWIIVARSGSGSDTKSSLLTVVQVWHEREGPTTPPEIVYRNKVRIALRNDSPGQLEINAYWIADGSITLELPETLKFRNEYERGGWRSNKWNLAERTTVVLNPGDAVSTWFGVGRTLTDAEFGRARENREFGTLAIRIVGTNKELFIRI